MILHNHTFTKEGNAMNLQNHFTKTDKNAQEISDNWNKIILPHLPENLDEIAKQEGVLKRKRGLRSFCRPCFLRLSRQLTLLPLKG